MLDLINIHNYITYLSRLLLLSAFILILVLFAAFPAIPPFFSISTAQRAEPTAFVKRNIKLNPGINSNRNATLPNDA